MPGMQFYNQAIQIIQSGFDSDNGQRHYLILFAWAFLRYIGLASGGEEFEITSRYWIDEWQLSGVLRDTFLAMGHDEPHASRMIETIKCIVEIQRWYVQNQKLPVREIVKDWLRSKVIQNFVGLNKFEDVYWFNSERFDDLLWWSLTIATLQAMANPKTTVTEQVEHTIGAYEVYLQLREAKTASGFQVEKLLNAIPHY